MTNSVKAALRVAFLRLSKPLLRMMMSAGIGYGEANKWLKTAYVLAAREHELESAEGRGASELRIAIVSGVTRHEVARILATENDEPDESERGRHQAERVLAAWWTDPEFEAEEGGPAALPRRGGRRSVESLVLKHSREPRAGPIIADLMRQKVVRKRRDNLYIPLTRNYASEAFRPEGIVAMGEGVGDVLATYAHNMRTPQLSRYLRRVQGLHLNPDDAPIVKRDLVSALEAFADQQYSALNDPQYIVEPSNLPQEAIRLGVIVCVIEEPTVVEPVAGRSRSRSTE